MTTLDELNRLLARCETEMRYAGWAKLEEDNVGRKELYFDVLQALNQPVTQTNQLAAQSTWRERRGERRFSKLMHETLGASIGRIRNRRVRGRDRRKSTETPCGHDHQ